MKERIHNIGIVIIGRNEGERLKRCLNTTLSQSDNIVYVDSGSTDGSVEYAKSVGVKVVELDMSIPFSAGRARNEGFKQLANDHLELEFVQFIDGDCELCEGWLSRSLEYLEKNEYCACCSRKKKRKVPRKQHL